MHGRLCRLRPCLSPVEQIRVDEQKESRPDDGSKHHPEGGRAAQKSADECQYA